jgi:hypothetical protein
MSPPNEHAPIGADEIAELRRLRANAQGPAALTKEHADWLRALDNAADGLLTLAERGLAAGAGETDEASKAEALFADLPQATRAQIGEYIAHRVATARARERARCERIAEEIADRDDSRTGDRIAAAIRNTQPEG